jgi:endogenous inhibitor of DNA gyrase (YacG/DUF329 family)
VSGFWFVGPVGFDSTAQRFTHACPACATQVETIRTAAPDKGKRRILLLAWCPDCREAVGQALSREAA